MSKREWKKIRDFEEIKFERWNHIAKITINRPRYYNAFTPTTTLEMAVAMDICREDMTLYSVVLTGEGDKAFCAGGDQNVKGKGGYIGKDGIPRLNVLDVQRKIRSIPKPVIAMVNGFAIGGGHVLHVVCDLTIASENARFGQTGPKVGSFDAGLGSSYPGQHSRAEKSPRNLVPQQTVHGTGSIRNGNGQQSGSVGKTGRRNRGLVPNHAQTQPHGPAYD